METKSLVLFAAVLLVVIFATFYFRSTLARQPSLDGRVLAQLKRAGSDLSKPHAIEFFMYFPTQEAAARTGSKNELKPFSVKIERATKHSQDFGWLLFATRSMVPVEAELVSIRRQFDSLSAIEGGKYDGWGTEVVK